MSAAMGNYDSDGKKSTALGSCMAALKWIPVIFIAAVIAWSYYAYVVQLCLLSIDNVFEQIVFLIFYHIICVLFFWSYWNTIFTPVGTVPPNWRIPEAEIEHIFHADTQDQQKRILENFAKTLPVTNRTLNGSVRFCEKCKIIKPDRAHHCSVCGACVLKMDHHCPWVNNCVNFTNYKYFVLFLGYALLYCLYVALTSLEYFIRFWRLELSQQGDLNGGMGRFHIVFLFFVSIMFAISLVSLFGYHVYLTLMNRTTLEAFRAPIFRVGGPDKNGYNLGKYANFQEVFGDNWKLWFLPVYTSVGDGLTYTTQKQHQMQSYDSMGDTTQRTSQHELLREDDTLPLNLPGAAVGSVSAASTATVKSVGAGVNGMVAVIPVQPAQPVEATIPAAADIEVLVVPTMDTANGNVIINMRDLESSNDEQQHERNNQNV
ncbi:palmitoyltransferase ZDHHC20-B isoform X1 [Bactrocera oleae]|uniref:palmitoyltransferase ZDHHC20-B isoform X1 n=1 Tax=Bactrocera oleae TaxID=104688 RepID=UPI0006B752C9|nr:palmitoyltransferase ZDHHC15B isoform X1 [Bactrocera oleae]XP_014085571.1 palmitoyltransferase ZDHHC15B isoform X1 [Bactrocera oleae]XP_014085586.1 palmitoyltransferase ZDHHC15B isoform X1 [Bactrocera oleae]XP_036223703.1 palmitoyltransferase ZDHHC15B isoform X1 [Bactrocera oleae]